MVVCPQLTSPQNGALAGCSAPYKFGSVCQQQCQSGYYRVQGTDTRSCMRDGTWSGQAVVCSSNGKIMVYMYSFYYIKNVFLLRSDLNCSLLNQLLFKLLRL